MLSPRLTAQPATLFTRNPQHANESKEPSEKVDCVLAQEKAEGELDTYYVLTSLGILSTLPFEVLAMIISSIPCLEKRAASETSREFHHLLHDVRMKFTPSVLAIELATKQLREELKKDRCHIGRVIDLLQKKAVPNDCSQMIRIITLKTLDDSPLPLGSWLLLMQKYDLFEYLLKLDSQKTGKESELIISNLTILEQKEGETLKSYAQRLQSMPDALYLMLKLKGAALVNKKDEHGKTILFYLIEQDRYGIENFFVMLLSLNIQDQLNFNIVDNCGNTLFHHLAQIKVNDGDFVKLFAYFFNLCKQKDFDFNYVNDKGSTALHLLCMNKKCLINGLLNDENAVLGLLENMSQTGINSKDNFGHTALFYAMHNKHYVAVKILLEAGASLQKNSVEVEQFIEKLESSIQLFDEKIIYFDAVIAELEKEQEVNAKVSNEKGEEESSIDAAIMHTLSNREPYQKIRNSCRQLQQLLQAPEEVVE